MADAASSAEDRAIDALTRVLESAISPDMLEAQQIILRRLALSGDLYPSRIPAPLNITQVGGYLNLIQSDPVLRAQVLASTLGVAGPNPSPGFEPTLPPLYFQSRVNDRPAGNAQASIPVSLRIRSDFAAAFDAAVVILHRHGMSLPVLATDRVLPPVVFGIDPPTDLLPFLGRALDLAPGSAFVDPTTDALALGQAAGAGPQLVLTRQLDATAPDAATVVASAFSVWTCTSVVCTQSTVTDSFLDLAPVLNAAGWYQKLPVAIPTSLAASNGWNHFTNITGLLPGVTGFGDELRLLFSLGQIAASSVRERQDWVWNGTTFAAPA